MGVKMDVPEKWRKYTCSDYFQSTLAETGWWDPKGQYWYIEPADRIREDLAREFLIIGGPGVDGIEWGYRMNHAGIWAYYPIEGRFEFLATAVSALKDGYSTGQIRV